MTRHSVAKRIGHIVLFAVTLAGSDAFAVSVQGAVSQTSNGTEESVSLNARVAPDLASTVQQTIPEAARHFSDWIIETHDNKSMPFVIVDKVSAEVFVFYPDGKLRGAAPALLGLAIGDDSVPGIGSRKLSTIRPEERTTPAGRFIASLDRNLHGEEILWIDYDAAISMHRVITSNPSERRLERLAAAAPLDHRISYGCINVPVRFYEQVISPTFTKTTGVVYVLPETRSTGEVFPTYNAAQRAHLRTSENNSAGNPSLTLNK